MIKALLRGLIRGYQWFISPLLGSNCRFTPSCSAYALEALEQHGALRGSWLAAKRLARCHPFSRHHGWDPVPGHQPDPSLAQQCRCTEAADKQTQGKKH
nr:membrane protein insertion efficiency factor YidD [Balneatrix alpica]